MHDEERAPEGRRLQRLSIRVGERDVARDLCDRLSAMAGEEPGYQATSWFEAADGAGYLVEAFYASPPNLPALLETISDLVLAGDGEVSLEDVPDENWVAISQAALPPVIAGRFIVHGSHDRALIGRRLDALEIEAGEAFGTAHHATTRGCLEALTRLAMGRPPKTVLDLGCGTGVLAIAASRLWPAARLVASDVDATSVEIARDNARHNRAASRIRFVEAMGFAHARLRAGRPYDLVVANILAGPLIRMAPEMARAVCPVGQIVLSGILGEQAREVIGTYRKAGFRLDRQTVDHNWATLVLTRMAPLARSSRVPGQRSR